MIKIIEITESVTESGFKGIELEASKHNFNPERSTILDRKA